MIKLIFDRVEFSVVLLIVLPEPEPALAGAV